MDEDEDEIRRVFLFPHAFCLATEATMPLPCLNVKTKSKKITIQGPRTRYFDPTQSRAHRVESENHRGV